MGKFFGFQAAEIYQFNASTGDFRFRLNSDLSDEFRAGWEGAGRWSLQEGWICTGIELKA